MWKSKCSEQHAWLIAGARRYYADVGPAARPRCGNVEPPVVPQVEAATRMRIPFQRLNAIVKGRRAVSADTALLLEALTGWNARSG